MAFDRVAYMKKWNAENREKCNRYTKKWRKKNKKYNRERIRLWREENPLSVKLMRIRYRCENSSDKKFHCYGGRGIKNLLTVSDLKKLWDRDNAGAMNKPSIDRIDGDGHYKFSNCRFIEMSENIRRAWSGRKHTKESIEKMKASHKARFK